VAFARALAPNPRVLLLDEPFAAIDSKLRKELRSWLRQMIDQLGITSIFVTHDQDEAVEVADEIIIINKGKVEQKGTPIEIYKTPKTAFVAQFIGQSDIIENYTHLKGFEQEDSNFQAILRPEFIQIGKDSEEIKFTSASEKGIVKAILFRGNNLEVKVLTGELLITANRTLEQAPLNEGDEVFVLIHRLYLFNDATAKVVENKAKVDPLPVFI
jgi:sulfate transport system ATP-binding protein